MTTVMIQGFRGLSANLELGQPLTLVVGPNGVGKTRIAQAIAAVLSSTAMPITGKTHDKKEALGDGADKAIVRLNAGDAMRALLWPAGETSVKGDQSALPHATVWAAWLQHPLDLSGKERAQAFADIFRTEPTQKDLATAFEKRGLSAHLKSVWEQIELSGWDAATKESEKIARARKGAWGEVTGATWGERVGETWEPETAADVDDLQAKLEMAEENLDDAKAALEDAQKARAALPEPQEVERVYACAHCGKPNVINFGKLEKADNVTPMSSTSLKEARMAIAEADGKKAHAQDQVYHREQAVGAAKARIADAAEAATKAKARAAELHRQITEQLAIAAVCGPQGLRKAKLEHVLAKVNDSLAEIAKDIGLPLVEIDTDLEATMDGTPFRRLSRAEQWICRTVMQIEIARRDGSTMIVVDDLDVPIDPKDRNKVLQALAKSGLQAIVLCAARSPEPRFAPDLEAAGIGLTYWIDRAHGLRPIAEVQKEQKAA